ncbi:ATP-binding protein [Paenibacillus sp. GCM10027626]|uniref:ATP-binding protein n=1 Tax=Paenibacillus sp. GCM10027626 TaxID=3273411 RepID=UPI00362A61D3
MGNGAIYNILKGSLILCQTHRFLAFMAVFIPIALLFPSSSSADSLMLAGGQAAAKPAAEKGVLDLRGWSFDKDGRIDLNGEWLFYAHELLSPEEAAASGPALFAEVPHSWNNYPEYYGFEDGQGIATYKLTILLTPSERRLALRVPSISSAYNFWINGKLMASAGIVGKSRENSSAEQYPRLIILDGNKERLELVVQVSNFHHRKGGIWIGFSLGSNKDMVKFQMRTAVQEMVIFGSLVIIGLYHMGLYAFRRQEQFTLYFGLLCLLVAARTSVTGDAYLLQMFPAIGWETGLKIEYISFVLSAVTGYLYICGLFPHDASVKIKRAVIALGILSCIPVLLLPALIYSRLLPFFQIFVLLVCFYSLYVLVMAMRRKREGACFVLAGVAVFVLTIMNDMLFYNEWRVSHQLVPLGLFFFILMQSFIISSRFSNALHRVELVTKELRELNAHLEERIAERTEALQAANETLERTNRELAKVENSRRHLMTNISHDLRTPITLLQGYLEAMQDGVIKTEEQQSKYIRMMLGKVAGLNRLIRDLFELSKLEAGDMRFDYSEVLLADWMERMRELFELDIRNHRLDFNYSFISDQEEWAAAGAPSAENISMQIDQNRMERVMANLVFNAIKYTAEGGKITIVYRADYSSGQVVIKVCDTGSGIAEEHLPYIFDRFYKKELARKVYGGGSGLGLAIVKEIVEAHHGKIGAESELGKGTVIWFTIPFQHNRAKGD